MPTMDRYHTNLAATFHVLSMLHRLQYDARLTLGTTRTIGIEVICEDGSKVDVEVKGLAGKYPWPVDSVGGGRGDLLYGFVCFGGTIRDVETTPEVWIIPSIVLPTFIWTAPGGKRIVNYRTLQRDAWEFKNAWDQLCANEEAGAST